MIQINELQLRVSGMNEESGAGFGKQLAEKIAASVPHNSGDLHIPELRIQLKDVSDGDSSLMADRVAEQIIKEIKLVTLPA